MKKTMKKASRTGAKIARSGTFDGAPAVVAAAHPPLGERIRRLRHERRWSLSELKKRSSIATSTLSKVENGLLSLPYDRLQLIASAFGLSLSEFFAADAPAEAAAVGRISWALRGSGEIVDSGAYIYHYLCTSIRTKRMVPILSQVVARNLAEFGRLLKHQGEEFVFTHRGRVEVHTECYKPQILEEGEGVYIDSCMGHAYTNAGPGQAWILSVNTNPISPQILARNLAGSIAIARRNRG